MINFDELGSSISKIMGSVAKPVVKKVDRIITDIKRPVESSANSFINNNWKQKEIIAPIPQREVLGSSEYLQNKSNKFWNQADYKDALSAEAKYAPVRIKQEAVKSGWVPIKGQTVSNVGQGKVLGVQAPTPEKSTTKFGPTTLVKKPDVVKQATQAAMSIKDPSMREKAIKTFPMIAEGFIKAGINNPKAVAYALSTMIGEAGARLDAVEPIYPPGHHLYQGQNEDYEGGAKYRGRGAIQLTHKSNYKKYGDMLGIDLVNNPDLAADPAISPMIMALFFKETGVLNEIEKGNYDRARVLIQGGGAMSPKFYRKTREIGNTARGFENILR